MKERKINIIIITIIILATINLIAIFNYLSNSPFLAGADPILHVYYIEGILQGNSNQDYTLGFHMVSAFLKEVIGLNVNLTIIIFILTILAGILVIATKIFKSKEVIVILLVLPILYNNLVNGAYSHIWALFIFSITYYSLIIKKIKNQYYYMLLFFFITSYHILTLFFVLPLFFLSEKSEDIKFIKFFIISQILAIPFVMGLVKIHIIFWLILTIIYASIPIIKNRLKKKIFYQNNFLSKPNFLLELFTATCMILPLFFLEEITAWSGEILFIILFLIWLTQLKFKKVNSPKICILILCYLGMYIFFGMFSYESFKTVHNLLIYYLLTTLYLLFFDNALVQIKINYKKLYSVIIFFLLVYSAFITGYHISPPKNNDPFSSGSEISLLGLQKGFGYTFAGPDFYGPLDNENFSSNDKVYNLGGIYSSWIFLYGPQVTHLKNYQFYNKSLLYGNSLDIITCNKNITKASITKVYIPSELKYPLTSPFLEKVSNSSLFIYTVINSEIFECLNYQNRTLNKMILKNKFYNYGGQDYYYYFLEGEMVFKKENLNLTSIKLSLIGNGKIQTSCESKVIGMETIKDYSVSNFNIGNCTKIFVKVVTGTVNINGGYFYNEQ